MGKSRSSCVTREQHRGDLKSKTLRNCGQWLGRMRVLGCGVSPPPDKRRFSNVNSSTRYTIAKGKPGVWNDSPARTFIENAESLARGSAFDQVAEGETRDQSFLRKSLEIWRDYIVLPGLCSTSKVREEKEKFTCFVSVSSLQQFNGTFTLQGVTPRVRPGIHATKSVANHRIAARNTRSTSGTKL